jgi:hypothetical protein
MNIEKYIHDVSKKPMWDLVLTYAWNEYREGKLTPQEFLSATKQINDNYKAPENLCQTEDYLLTVSVRATPDAVKAAKKTPKTFMEQLIYKDEKDGLLSPSEAARAKAALPDYLTKNKTDVISK